MQLTQKHNEQLKALAAYFAERRKPLLQNWINALKNDPELTSPDQLSRTQIYDHIPDILDDYQARLSADSVAELTEAEEETEEDGAVHGLHRWQQGYQLREVIREWGHLHLCMMEELESYTVSHPETEPEVMTFARRTLVELCNEGASESTSKYFQLRQSEAAGHVTDLQQTLDQLHVLQRQRAELWRQAAHDLRGNVGIVKNVTQGLSQKGLPEIMHEEFLRLLQRSVASLHAMLDEVINLSRLEAGQETRDVRPFDAALLLNELCDSLRTMADERNLFLKTQGPVTLPVEGDTEKIKRIVQNLMLNALKYTGKGGITIRWGYRDDDDDHWAIYVQDTGPGFHAGPGAPVAAALEEATRQAHQSEADRPRQTDGSAGTAADSRTIADPRPIHQEPGEGIGLSIVKRLCELLDATLELDSAQNKGTFFCIVLPRSYKSHG